MNVEERDKDEGSSSWIISYSKDIIVSSFILFFL